jgi:hypothetical protein
MPGVRGMRHSAEAGERQLDRLIESRAQTAPEEERERRSMAEGTMRRNLAAAAQIREESPAPVPPTEGEGPAEETIIGAIEGEGA